jgi:hypothetical protein
MTGATGDLTPDDADEAFVPGERREIEDPDARARVTTEQAGPAPAEGGDERDERSEADEHF